MAEHPLVAADDRAQEASVLLEGSGLINVQAADTPLIFSDPASLSFGQIKPANGTARSQMLFTVQDAGGGAGTWSVELHPQSASQGASLELPPVVTVPVGGTTTFAVAATAAAGSPTGDDTGFVILRKEKQAPKDFNGFAAGLTKDLDKRIPDFQKRSSKLVNISAGKAFFYSYIRKQKGTVHTIVLVPAGKQSYVLNTVSSGSSTAVAREIARIILTFKT